MCKFYFLYILLLFFCSKGFTQVEAERFTDTSNVPSTHTFDHPYSNNTVLLHPVHVSEDSLASRRAQKIYAYHHNLDSLLKAWKNESLSQSPRSTSIRLPSISLFGNGVFRVIIWAAAILFAVFILYKLFLNKGFFYHDTRAANSLQQLTEEEIFFKNDYNNLIKQALVLGDYRVALRYHFLKTLYQLHDKKMLEFAPDKTNLKYYYELPVNMKEGFRQISRHYEYAWYGQVVVSREQFEAMEKNFKRYEEIILN